MLRLILRALFSRSYDRKTHQAPPDEDNYPRRRSVTVRKTQRTVVQRQVTTTVSKTAPQHETTLSGKCYVVDGDTIRIGKVNIRLAGIDAPELEHPWGKKAKWELVGLCKGNTITAEIEPELSYDRVVATCYLPDGRDLSAEMVRMGMALDWPKFSGGKYAHLEPDGVRKKHWKAAARQRGHMSVFEK